MPGPLPNGLNQSNLDHFADRNAGGGFLREYDRGTILAHAAYLMAAGGVGLHPAGSNYGADPTFLRWGNDWKTSRPYIGLNGPDWASLALFVNNGGLSEWNALVNVDDGGMPTQFENTVYCRVRNVGDQPANGVAVTFQYAKISSAGVTWLTVADANGVAQTLNVGTLAAGASNFPDSDQNNPPASASVKWYLPPIPLGCPGTCTSGGGGRRR